jgi:hypothetical protein
MPLEHVERQIYTIEQGASFKELPNVLKSLAIRFPEGSTKMTLDFFKSKVPLSDFSWETELKKKNGYVAAIIFQHNVAGSSLSIMGTGVIRNSQADQYLLDELKKYFTLKSCEEINRFLTVRFNQIE